MTTNALTASQNADKPVLATFDFNGKTYDVVRKPSSLLLAELARVGSGDPEAIGVLAEFFEVTMGREGYQAFRRDFYAAEVEDDSEVLMALLSEVLEKALGRPTE